MSWQSIALIVVSATLIGVLTAVFVFLRGIFRWWGK